MTSKGEQPQRPQWFIGADGTVIQTWPPGPDNDRLKYVRFRTTRRLELSDLYAMEDEIERFTRALERRSRVLLVLVALGIAGMVTTWLVLPLFAVATTATAVVFLISLAIVFAAPLIARFVSGASRSGFEQIHLDAGLESSVPRTIKDSEARALIDAPGTVAGRPPDAER